MNWPLSVIIICVLLALLFSWQEYRRSNRQRLGWRILAVWLATGALACIALPIAYTTRVPAPGQASAVLLTPGFVKDSIPPRARVFTFDKALQKEYPGAILSTATQITAYKPAFKRLTITGCGLDYYDLQLLGNLPLSYVPPVAPAGIQAISWPAMLKTGEALNIQGHYKNTAAKPVKLLLKELNVTVDSTILPAGKSTDFSLTTRPKPTGRIAYQLLALLAKDTLMAEMVPVQIEPVEPFKVLMLNAAPSFETRFLKNWLGKNGYQVAARATISQNKMSEEYVNLDKMNLKILSVVVFDKFDLVIADLSALQSLSAAEEAALKQQVTQKGLGVIIRADSSGKAASWLQHDFPVNSIASKNQLSVPLMLQGSAAKTDKLSIDPSYISYRNNTQVLVTDAQNHELAGTSIAGAGKLVFTTLNRTYNWLLAGNQRNYAALWSLLIGKSARKLPATPAWRISSAVPALNEPVSQVFNSGALPAGTSINEQTVPWIQNANIPYEWTTTYWPEKTGWQTGMRGTSLTNCWYTYKNTAWKNLRNRQLSLQTQKFIKNATEKTSVTKQIQQNNKIEVPKIFFYLLLLANCTFLWVERKFAG